MLYALLIIFALLQFADGYTTDRLLTKGGRELNPILARIFAACGVRVGLIAVKTTMCVVIVALSPWLPVWALAAFAAIYVAVVVHNWRQL